MQPRLSSFWALSLLLASPAAWAGTDTVPSTGAAAASAASQTHRPPEYQTVVRKKLSDTDATGAYHQAVWTTKRPYTMTRVYVRPKGMAAVDYWLITGGKLEGGAEPSFESKLEFEFGVGARIQLDAYLIFGQDSYEDSLRIKSEELEIRYALADWGVIPTNPTLFVEWVRQNEAPQKIETKLLLGDTIGPRWYWGADLFYETVLGQDWRQEWGVSFGLSAVAKPRLVHLGIEGKFEGAHEKQGDSWKLSEIEFLAGPSLSLTPGRFNILLVPLFGAERELEEPTQPGGEREWETEAVYKIFLILGAEI